MNVVVGADDTIDSIGEIWGPVFEKLKTLTKVMDGISEVCQALRLSPPDPRLR